MYFNIRPGDQVRLNADSGVVPELHEGSRKRDWAWVGQQLVTIKINLR